MRIKANPIKIPKKEQIEADKEIHIWSLAGLRKILGHFPLIVCGGGGGDGGRRKDRRG